MNAKTQANYRKRKVVRDFAVAYLKGFMSVSPEKFIDAKQDEYCKKHSVRSVSFNETTIDTFYKNIKSLDDLDGTYQLTELLEAWEQAMRFLPLSDFK